MYIQVIIGLLSARLTLCVFPDHPMKDVVITVPSFFNQAERRAVIR